MRQDIHHYFMDIADVVSHRSTCDRRLVGAVIVKDKMIVSTGYNGSIAGAAHCEEVGHDMVDGHCVRTVHAEMNALAQAARRGSSVDGGTLYVTSSPCFNCFKNLANAGIKKIFYANDYPDEKTFQYAKEVEVEIVRLKEEE